MEIITQRYRRETGKSAYKNNWFGKRIHNQDYVDWLEKQCTIHGVSNQRELLIAFLDWYDNTIQNYSIEEDGSEIVDDYLKSNL